MYSTLVRGLGGLRLAPRESLASDTRRCFSVAAARQQWNGQRATGRGETIEQHPHTRRRGAHHAFPGYLARHSPTLTCPHQVPVRCFSISTLKFSDLVQAEVAKAASSPAMGEATSVATALLADTARSVSQAASKDTTVSTVGLASSTDTASSLSIAASTEIASTMSVVSSPVSPPPPVLSVDSLNNPAINHSPHTHPSRIIGMNGESVTNPAISTDLTNPAISTHLTNPAISTDLTNPSVSIHYTNPNILEAVDKTCITNITDDIISGCATAARNTEPVDGNLTGNRANPDSPVLPEERAEAMVTQPEETRTQVSDGAIEGSGSLATTGNSRMAEPISTTNTETGNGVAEPTNTTNPDPGHGMVEPTNTTNTAPGDISTKLDDVMLPSGKHGMSSGPDVLSTGAVATDPGSSAAAGGAVGGGGGGVVAGADAAATPTKELILDFLPEKPTPLDPSVLVGEPSFESLGLASWWPSGRLQYFMEHLHITLDFDWYQAIALTALCLRIISFPLVVIAQRNVANMNNNMPGMAVIQEKMTEARQRGDHMETAQYGKELQEYMNKRGINPIKNVFPVLVQLPIFMSMFFGLRSMANLPVPSMEQGGALWFENLAMADPFYLLPILTSGTLYLQIRMGADGNRLDSMGPTGRIFFTVFPFVLVPLTMNFPSAVTFYWLSTNVISCTQAAILRLPAVRSALGIPKLIVWDKSKTPGGKKKGFRESVRESIDNWRVQSDIADRRAMDEAAFREAGSSKAPKTYAYDPTKPVAIKMKKR